jgi:DNA-binding MarR family transcriptional regulator
MAKGKGKAGSNGLAASPIHLLHRVLQLAVDFHSEAAGPSAVTQRQFTVLAAAGSAEGLTQNDLVRATGIDRSTLADMVARMLAKGLLERERSATDARANTVRLSAAGRAALGQSSGPAARADARLLGLLPPKRREAFVKSLASLASAADEPVAPTRKAKPAKTAKSKTAKTKPTKAAKPSKKRKKKSKKNKEIGA